MTGFPARSLPILWRSRGGLGYGAGKNIAIRSTVSALHTIFSTGQRSPVLYGPAHGNLHTTNVVIRGGDALIIDCESV